MCVNEERDNNMDRMHCIELEKVDDLNYFINKQLNVMGNVKEW